jgi:hypothetical protein
MREHKKAPIRGLGRLRAALLGFGFRFSCHHDGLLRRAGAARGGVDAGSTAATSVPSTGPSLVVRRLTARPSRRAWRPLAALLTERSLVWKWRVLSHKRSCEAAFGLPERRGNQPPRPLLRGCRESSVPGPALSGTLGLLLVGDGRHVPPAGAPSSRHDEIRPHTLPLNIRDVPQPPEKSEEPTLSGRPRSPKVARCARGTAIASLFLIVGCQKGLGELYEKGGGDESPVSRHAADPASSANARPTFSCGHRGDWPVHPSCRPSQTIQRGGVGSLRPRVGRFPS